VSGCADTVVKTEAVTLPRIAPELMRAARDPKCDPPRRPEYAAQEIDASRVCWKNAHGAAAARLAGLQRAVRVREAAAAAAVKAGSITP
jgi:hypothetical protein